MAKYDLSTFSGYLFGKNVEGFNYEMHNISNLLANKLEQNIEQSFYIGDVINFPDNDLIIVMCPNYTDKILAFMLLNDISPEQLQDWLDGMLANLSEEEYNKDSTENQSDSEVSQNEKDVTIPSTEELQLSDFDATIQDQGSAYNGIVGNTISET